MDAAHVNTTRKFPTYTLAQLEAAVGQYLAGTHALQAYLATGHVEAIKTEIANRKAGISQVFVVPQIR